MLVDVVGLALESRSLVKKNAARVPKKKQPDPLAGGALELAKWVALIAMFIDHYGKIVDPNIYLETHAIGRLAFPLFAGIIGVRLARCSKAAIDRYLRNLFVWALLSQPAFVLAGRDWYDGNIYFDLLLGVLAAKCCFQYIKEPEWQTAAMIIVSITLASFLDYGPFGILIIPVMALLVQRHGKHAIWAVGPLGVLANAEMSMPVLGWVDLAALGASVVLFFSVKWRLRLPRLPKLFFYAFYPAHLLALHFFDLYR